MNRQNWRGVVLFLLGVALLANPLYLYPDGVSYETELTIEATQTNEIPRYGFPETDIHWCRGYDRECAIAEALADGATLRYDIPSHREPDDYDEPFPAEYDYIRLTEGEDSYYRPVQTVENESIILSIEPVSDETVRQAAAEEYESTRPYIKSAIENGSATVTELEVSLRPPVLVERDGVYYEIRETGKERYPTGWGWKAPSRIVVEAMRLAAWIGGVALVWRAGEWTERGR